MINTYKSLDNKAIVLCCHNSIDEILIGSNISETLIIEVCGTSKRVSQ
jgi:hypothetical protein